MTLDLINCEASLRTDDQNLEILERHHEENRWRFAPTLLVVENEDVTRVANAVMATGWGTIPKHQVIVIIHITDFENSGKLLQSLRDLVCLVHFHVAITTTCFWPVCCFSAGVEMCTFPFTADAVSFHTSFHVFERRSLSSRFCGVRQYNIGTSDCRI